MLELRPNCECCGKYLSPESNEAFICSLECTFCSACTDKILQFTCPNCSGNLVQRPSRLATVLEKYPASAKYVLKESVCK